MTNRKNPPDAFDDIEKPHPLVAELRSDAPRVPLTVRLSDLWDDVLPIDSRSDPESPRRPASALPLLDEMKGILQWD